jgi:hypothetical protein
MTHTPSANEDDTKLLRKARTDPGAFQWRIDEKDHLVVRAMLHDIIYAGDPMILRCTSTQVARLVVITHNSGLGYRRARN